MRGDMGAGPRIGAIIILLIVGFIARRTQQNSQPPVDCDSGLAAGGTADSISAGPSAP
jgi:hypothetical protein